MDIIKILVKYFEGYAWNCGDTYESLEWLDTTTAKPTKGHLESLWSNVLKDEMREERNQLLKENQIIKFYQTFQQQTNKHG